MYRSLRDVPLVSGWNESSFGQPNALLMQMRWKTNQERSVPKGWRAGRANFQASIVRSCFFLTADMRAEVPSYSLKPPRTTLSWIIYLSSEHQENWLGTDFWRMEFSLKIAALTSLPAWIGRTLRAGTRSWLLQKWRNDKLKGYFSLWHNHSKAHSSSIANNFQICLLELITNSSFQSSGFSFKALSSICLSNIPFKHSSLSSLSYQQAPLLAAARMKPLFWSTAPAAGENGLRRWPTTQVEASLRQELPLPQQ